MKTSSLFAKSAAILITATALGACQSSVGAPGLNDEIVRNSVQLVRFNHTIKAEDDGTDTLSAKTINDLSIFLANTNVGYGDVLMIDSVETASQDRVDAVAKLVRARGLTYAGRTLLGAKPDEGDLVLYVERYSVTPPNCGNWPKEPNSSRRNNRSSFNSCATIANLGLMVANPRDLITGQSASGSTGAAVGAVLGGTPTATTSTSDRSRVLPRGAGGTAGTGATPQTGGQRSSTGNN